MSAHSLSTREEREFEAYVRALLTTGKEEQILKNLSELEVPSPYRVRVKVVYSPSSPISVLNQLTQSQRLERLSQEATTYVHRVEVGTREVKKFQVPFVATHFTGDNIGKTVNAIIAVCKRSQWTALRRFIRHQYPDIVPILLSQAELIQGAKSLKQITGHAVQVRAFSAKERLRTITGRGRKSIREWTDEELDEALLNIQDRHQVVTSLDVDFLPRVGGHSHIRPKASCKIRKDGEIEVSGSFKLAFDAVATQVARVGEKKLSFFHGRGLRETQYTPRPLAINYPSPLFDDVKVVRSFVQVLAKYPQSMHAVAHGNPYAHVRLTDLFDGSSFDIWAITPQRVALIPGLKASEAAFERIVHYIFDAFREGRIATYDREERPMETAS